MPARYPLSPVCACSFALLTGCAAKHYPLNLKLDPEIGDHVVSTARAVDTDFPEDFSSDDRSFESYVLLTWLASDSPPAGTRPEEVERWRGVARALRESLDKRIVARAYETTWEGEVAYHEVTVGTIGVPFDDFLSRFDPAADWGKNLWKYKGGELTVDAKDESGRPTLQRERMVLGTPWFAVGAPDLDMSKYEVIEYTPDLVRVNWVVTESENQSVFLDIGYLEFRKYSSLSSSDEPGQVLAIFNSIHNVDPGGLGRILPASIRTGLTRKTLRKMFFEDLKNYRKLLRK